MTHRERLEQMARMGACLWIEQIDALKWALSEIDRLTALQDGQAEELSRLRHIDADAAREIEELRQRLIAAEARGEQRGREAQCGSCETCGCQGHGWRNGIHYAKCMEHSLPCEDLGGYCGKWTPLTEPQKEDTSGTK